MNTLLLAALLSGGYIGFVAGFEALSRKFVWSHEVTRRVVHVVSGLSTLLDFWLLPSGWFLFLISTSLIGIIVSQWRGWLKSVHQVKRHTYGEIFLPVGTLTTWAICMGRPSVFVPAILLMTFADAAAGLTSDFLKQERKMIRGSLVFFALAFLILWLGGFVAALPALLVAGVVTLVERFSPIGSDNFTVPFATAVLLLMV